MAKLSQRLEALLSMVTPGNVLCDVGTDHGFVPIELLRRNLSKSAIAMDLRKGPLERAKEHIEMAGFGNKIETRLSDGVAALSVGEADTILIAGMGGEVMLHILREGSIVCHSVKELILQPQSEISEVRKYLRYEGYQIVAEDMVLEDGKYYPMMRVVPLQENVEVSIELEKASALGLEQEEIEAVCDAYGPLLLQSQHEVLLSFLKKEQGVFCDIKKSLERQEQSKKVALRLEQLKQEIALNETALRIQMTIA